MTVKSGFLFVFGFFSVEVVQYILLVRFRVLNYKSSILPCIRRVADDDDNGRAEDRATVTTGTRSAARRPVLRVRFGRVAPSDG